MSVSITSSEYIQQHQYFTARKDGYITTDGKKVDPYFVVELPVSACAMAITANNEVIMVKQYRHPIGIELLELPGGFIDANETPEQAIARELLEETGYAFTDIFRLGKTAANPGVLNNYTYMFLATGGKKVGEQQLDANEEIAIHLQPVEAIRTMLEKNEIVQSMHALCMFYGFAELDRHAMPQV
jgi:8-oxo-dGTP pyrophosphatase MutT (NUDIX family)